MSIKTEAQAVRAETVAKANTAERVGKVLEDIADDLVAKQVVIDGLTASVDGLANLAANKSTFTSVSSDNVGTNCVVAGNWYKVANVTSDDTSGRFIRSSNNIMLFDIGDPAFIHIFASLTVYFPTAGQLFDIGIAINGVVDTKSIVRAYGNVGVTNSVAISTSLITAINSGSIAVYVRCVEQTDTVYVSHMVKNGFALT